MFPTAVMIDLTDENKLTARSTPDINEAFTILVARMSKDPSIRYKDKRKSNRAAVLNSILLWVASRPLEEQRDIVRVGMDALNRHLESGLLDLDSLGASGEASNPVIAHDSPAPAPSKRKGKSAG